MYTSIIITALLPLSSVVNGFSTPFINNRQHRMSITHTNSVSSTSTEVCTKDKGTPFFLDVVSTSEVVSDATPPPVEKESRSPTAADKSSKKASKIALKNNHKQGVFSPLVMGAKAVVGEDRLNQIRAKAISMHSDVIGKFVETSDSEFGQTVLDRLFDIIDVNEDGTVDKDELKRGLRILGFSWLEDKQVEGILKRADKDANGVLDPVEFRKEAPKTLKTNLKKLAKKNGGDMGLLV